MSKIKNKRPSNQPIRKALQKITGKKLPSKIHIDHKIPLKDGGKNNLQNIQLLPEEAHQKKTAAENKLRAAIKKLKGRK